VAWGVSDFLGGLQSRRLPVLSVVVITYPFGLLLIAPVALAAGGSISGSDAGVAALAGAAGAIAIGLFYLAMAIGPVSLVAPVASMGVVVPVAVGLLRGEAPSGVQAAGLVLAIVGIALAVREAEAPHTVAVPKRSLLLAAVSGLGFGVFFVGIDAAASDDALWAATLARAGGVVAIAAAALAAPARVVFSRPALPALLAIGALDVSANSLFALATSEGLLSLVSVAGSLYPVTTVLLARLVLGERLARLQRAGVVVALAGVAAIAAG
jgi:drug/metabolite transporter (DMT)-like permease